MKFLCCTPRYLIEHSKSNYEMEIQYKTYSETLKMFDLSIVVQTQYKHFSYVIKELKFR